MHPTTHPSCSPYAGPTSSQLRQWSLCAPSHRRSSLKSTPSTHVGCCATSTQSHSSAISPVLHGQTHVARGTSFYGHSRHPGVCHLQVLWDVATGEAICGSPNNTDFVLCCEFLHNK